MQPQLLAQTNAVCGENPLWDDRRQLLFWCDIPAGQIYAYSPATGRHHTVFQGPECGAFTLQEDGRLLLLYTTHAATLDPESQAVQTVAQNLTINTGRFNDCLALPDGSVLSGTTSFTPPHLRGGIHHLTLDGQCSELWRGTNCSNGWGLTPDETAVYFSDTTAARISLFPLTGERPPLGPPSPWMDFPGQMPDGFTVDQAGNLWVAFWDGACVRRYSPQGTLQLEVPIPAKHVTSCAFGGAELDQLFITTAGFAPDDATLPAGTGGLFSIRPDIPGKPDYRSRIALSA